MPLGDSNTEGGSSAIAIANRAGYRDKLEELLNGSRMEGLYDFVGSENTGGNLVDDTNHAGFGGARDEDIATLLKDGKYKDYDGKMRGGKDGPYLDQYNPDIILLHIGTNWIDPSPGGVKDVENILNQIDEFEARAKKEVTVILARIILTAGQNAGLDAATKTYNDNVRAMAVKRVQAGDKIVFVDMQSDAGILYKIAADNSGPSEGDMADNLHPNRKGYDKMAAVWFNALQDVMTPDTQAPETKIDDKPAAVSTKNSATFKFSSDENGVNYQVSLDNAAFAQATTPFTVSGLAEGEHTLKVRAVDAAGNTDQTPATYSWLIDTKAPAAPVVTAPANGAILGTSKPAFTGTAEANSTVAVSVDAAVIGSVKAAANGSWSLTPSTALADGTHTVSAKASDAAGNVSANSNTNTFVVDATTPDTKIDAAPAALTNDKNATFDFSSNRQQVTFEASLDGAAFAAVSDPLVLKNLSDGQHTLRVRAKSQAGTPDPTPASHTWTIDTKAPAAPVVSAPAEGAVLSNNKPAITGTAEAGSRVTLYIGGSQLGTVTAGADGEWRFVPATALAEGAQQLTASATDAVGNTSETSGARRFAVDSRAPETTVASGPSAVSNRSEAAFSFGSNEAGVTFWVSLDGAAFKAVASPFELSNLADGAHTLAVRAADAAGNTDATPATHNWLIDTKAPGAPVFTGITEDRGPETNDQVTADHTIRIAGKAEAGAVVRVAEEGAEIGRATANASGSWEYNHENTSLPQGSYTFTATATDAAGNTSAASAGFAVTIELTAPEVSIAKAPGAPSNAAFNILISFTEEVYGLTAADFEITNAVLSNLAASDKASYTATVTPAGDGKVQLLLPAGKATDLAGNLNRASVLLETTHDATRPRLTLGSEAPAAVNAPFTVTFTFSEAVSGFAVSDITVTNGSAGDFNTLNDRTYTALIRPGEDGETSVKVAAGNAQDGAANGNEASETLKRIYDAQRPTALLSTTAPNPTKAPFTVTLAFSEPVEGVAAGDLRLTNANASQLSKINDKTYTVLITPVTAGEVAVALAANVAQDMAANGNQASNELRLLYDADRPVVTAATTAALRINAPFIVTFRISEAVTGFDLADIAASNARAENLQKISEGEYTALITPTTDGKVTVRVPANKMADAATNGNTASNVLELTYDATAPAGYTVQFGVERVDVTNQNKVALHIEGAETGASYTYSIRSSNGDETITGTAEVATADFTVAGLDLTGLRDGRLTVSLTLTDAVGNQGPEVTAQVEKLTKNIEAVQAFSQIKVPFKTAFGDVPLPGAVEVTYTNGEQEELSVTWEKGKYRDDVPGIYALVGVLELKENTSNLSDKTASITVEVAPNQPPTALTLSKDTFEPNIEPHQMIGTFATADPDDSDFIYALVAGEGDTHNQLFELSNDNELTLNSNKGLSGIARFTIRVRSTDPYDNHIEQTFTLTKAPYQPQGKIKLVNAFSPDGDGTNDTWTVPELRYYNAIEVEVFDRAGVRLFHTTNPEQGWDGRGTDGRILKGSYFYIIRIKDINMVQKGVLTVLN
ncbi:hypothetical protein GCM10023188_32900 [Pontibacter saemangeumensis]|uniref:Gliding motility-associated C-terminal domain-containing protein n=2 Tax=Pontibacter saemangeumensis TaxID=1084525 RepID=A0ABP8LY91_9BACT